MQQLEFEEALEIAQKYVGNKKRVPSFKVTYAERDELGTDEGYFPFSEEQLALFKEWKRDIVEQNYDYTYEEWLTEVRNTEYDPYILGGFIPCRVIDVDIDSPKFFVEFIVSFLCVDESGKRSLRDNNFGVNMPNKAYARLLAWRIHNPNLSFNRLYFVDKDLYNDLLTYIENNYLFSTPHLAQCPYLVEMSEINKDYETIINNEKL